MASLLASAYMALGIVFHPISFLVIQVRVATALYPLIALFGMPAFIGLTAAHFLLNLTSPLGPIDLLSPVVTLPAKYAVMRFGIRAEPLHVLTIALWVPFMLSSILGIPYWPAVAYVGAGEAIAEIGLGFPLYFSLKRALSKCWPHSLA